MLEIVAGIGGGAFVVACLVVGMRLLLLSWKTGELPELSCGLGLVLMGGLGYPLLVVVEQAHSLPMGTRCVLLFAQMFCHMVANTAFAFFNYRVFRPGVAWAKAVVLLCFLTVVGFAVAQLVGPGLVSYVESPVGPWRWHGAAAMLTIGWAAIESTRFYRQLRRRAVLGLTDPVVADRVRLWAIGMTSAFFTSAIGVLMESMGLVMVQTTFGAAVIAVLGSISAGTTWFAFLPPAWYLRRVRERAASAPAD
jgi:hypothetical protein